MVKRCRQLCQARQLSWFPCSCTAFHTLALGLFSFTCPRCKALPISTRPALEDLPTMVQFIISGLARIRGEVLGWNYSFSSLVLALRACKHGDLYEGHLAVHSRANRALFSLVRSVRPFPQIFFAAPQSAGVLLFLDASKQEALRSSHQLCSGPELCDMLCGRLCLWRGVTRAGARALGMTISYFGQEPNRLCTHSTHVLWEFALCTRWQSYMARQELETQLSACLPWGDLAAPSSMSARLQWGLFDLHNQLHWGNWRISRSCAGPTQVDKDASAKD